jgi:hypothetical protein
MRRLVAGAGEDGDRLADLFQVDGFDGLQQFIFIQLWITHLVILSLTASGSQGPEEIRRARAVFLWRSGPH